ncbi:MAG: hypothetical protein M9947_16820, partial [Thermomicrobiales bacterium]|nr:hypothetical protein [Thermomicrobiales bacterium]
LAAEATLAAFATQQAESNLSNDELTNQLATAAAQATENAASAQQTIEAQQTQAAEVALIATQNAESGANDLATAQAEAAAAQATAEALAAANQSSDSDIATAQAAANQIEATVAAISTQQAASNATATVLAQQAAQGSIDPSKVELSIDVDYAGLINGDPDAIEETSDALADILEPYQGCRVGLSLTFGWSSDLQTGIAVAGAVNQILEDDFPEIFGDAALEDFASLQDPPGRVDLEFFFYKGCDALGT